MAKSLKTRIDEIFHFCRGSSHHIDFRSLVKSFWPVLDNSTSLVDLAGVFSLCASTAGTDRLDSTIFQECFNGIARIKYPNGVDFCERLYDDLMNSARIKANVNSAEFSLLLDKKVMKLLLKFDSSLRRVFSTFCGQSVKIGRTLTWNEVKSKSIGMEIDGFTSFAGAHSLIPSRFTLRQCESLVKYLLTNYPLIGTSVTLNCSLLFPQFQLILCFIASGFIPPETIPPIESLKLRDSESSLVPSEASSSSSTSAASSSTNPNAASPSRPTSKSLPPPITSYSFTSLPSTADGLLPLLLRLFHEIGIDPVPASEKGGGGGESVPGESSTLLSPIKSVSKSTTSSKFQNHILFDEQGEMRSLESMGTGTVNLPMSQHPIDLYSSSASHLREGMAMRMDGLLDRVQQRFSASLGTQAIDQLSDILQREGPKISPLDGMIETRSRLTSKPVVVGDAIPVPSCIPEPVEQLLQAALAHHNLNNYVDSLKFLEASRIQLIDLERRAIAAKQAAEARAKEEAEAAAAAAALNASNNNSNLLGGLMGRGNHLPPHLQKGGPTTTAPASNPSVPLTSSSPSFETPASLIPDDQIPLPLDLEMYVTLCKGNVYQSSGDDEQSLLCYMEGWERAWAAQDKDWMVVCLISIGMLAYFNVRYELAFVCFNHATTFRQEAYGEECLDTTTCWNNEGCALYCLGSKGEARLRFERAWAVACQILGHRSPRCVTLWKNLEKVRRSQAPSQTKKILMGSIGTTSGLTSGSIDSKDRTGLLLSSNRTLNLIREDADKLLLGGQFVIKGIPPPQPPKKKKSGGGKKKKKS